MEKFPNLNSNQVAMVFADPNTGHVLDVKFNLAINKDQSCYLIFNSKIEAIEYASQIVLNNNVECVVYDSQQNVLSIIEKNGNKIHDDK